MGLYQWIGKWNGENRFQEVAEEVAARSRDAVWQRVRQRLATLGLNEARGYIRARAAVIIHEEVEHVVHEERSLSATQQSRLVNVATELVIRMVMGQQRAIRPQIVATSRAA